MQEQKNWFTFHHLFCPPDVGVICFWFFIPRECCLYFLLPSFLLCSIKPTSSQAFVCSIPTETDSPQLPWCHVPHHPLILSIATCPQYLTQLFAPVSSRHFLFHFPGGQISPVIYYLSAGSLWFSFVCLLTGLLMLESPAVSPCFCLFVCVFFKFSWLYLFHW